MNPGREGLRQIVRMSMGMNRDQYLLQKILRFCSPMPNSCEAIPIIGAQMSRQPLEKPVIRYRIAIETGGH
jgi:hypothetical protein